MEAKAAVTKHRICLHDCDSLIERGASYVDASVQIHAGGRRVITVPSAEGFGEAGGSLAGTLHVPSKQGNIPSDATLTYDLELIRVSIPPS